MLLEALTLQLGYNATLVAFGASTLGIAAAICGSFLYLRKRALVSDAISHATLPGVGLAFIVMVALGFDGRWLPGLLAGSAITAGLGLWWLTSLTRNTRLTEDAAIGAVLSVFFGFGIVLLTVIQSMSSGRQAGLEDFLLGATASMLRNEAWTIFIAGGLALAVTLLLRRAFLMVSFDPGFAEARGLPVGRIDTALLALVLAVTVIGLKVVGLILIVALLIIPPAAARFWSERTDVIIAVAGAIGGLSGFLGSALSAAYPNVPTGPVIVIVAFAAFAISFLLAPERGVLAGLRRHRDFQTRVHLRQGLIAIAQGQDVLEARTRHLLRRKGYMRRDGVVTDAGERAARATAQDEARWRIWRNEQAQAGILVTQHAIDFIETHLTPDEIDALDTRSGLRGVT
ncbi:metal ABC transporter permease [Primorskyibacter sp. S187A]|uniref:metal ABC transporter permease n=1 Tax=Primorskyibacter sp. S187A TaxID=3415130 RepID=UPI003C79F757